MALLHRLEAARDFLDTLDVGIIVLDHRLEAVWRNRYFRERMQPDIEMCEKRCFTGLLPGDNRCEDCLPPQVLRTGRTLETLRTITDPRGVPSTFRVVLTPTEDEDGGVIVFMLPLSGGEHRPGSVWRERFLLSAIRDSSDAVFALDRQHTVRFWNRGAERLFGWTVEEIVGYGLDHLLPDDDREAAEDVFMPADPSTPLANRELLLNRRQGGPVWVEVSRTPLLDGSGIPNGYSFVVRDITERKQALEKMAFTERMSAVGNMAAALAHEIGTPLGIISGNAELLLMDADATAREDLEVILRETERIGGLVKNLLEFARPETPVLEELTLGEVVRRVERLVRHTARGQGTTLIVEIDDDVPTIEGDPNQLEQVVLNLVMNALQALGKGGAVTLNVSGGEGALLSVTDDGPGIEPGSEEAIFHPFFTTKPNGTGLGLAVCKRIVEEHGGRLSVQNVNSGAETQGEAKGGATFKVWLPALEPKPSR